jgi:hypothetical protein
MRFISTPKVGTNALSQLFGGEEPIAFDHIALSMDPFGFNGIEPGTLRGQKQRQNTHAFALGFDLTVMLSYPGPHDLAHMKGGVIPDQQPGGFPFGLQADTTPFQKLGGNIADGATRHETQRHLLAKQISDWSLLPQHAITGERFGVRIIFLPALLHQTDWLLSILPGMQARESKPAPPPLVQKPDGPAWLTTCPGYQPVACVFLAGTGDRGS